MKNKKILILLTCVLIIILIALFFIIKKFNNNSETSNEENTISEYTPEEEISSEQMRETIVTLYFVDSNNELKSEGKLIDSAELVENPYYKLVELLFEGSQSNSLSSPFPENTQFINTSFENNCVSINFSEEILNYSNDEQKYNIINSLLNTLTQLNEVTSIKILVNNATTQDFSEEYSLSN